MQPEYKVGYAPIRREFILDHPRSGDPEWFAVVLRLALSCEYAPFSKKEYVFKGEKIRLRKGQIISSRQDIADATGVHPSKVQRVLNWLENDQLISQQSGGVTTLYSFTNIDLILYSISETINIRSGIDQGSNPQQPVNQ